MSKFEDKVAKILKDNNIQFKREVSFSDLKSLRGKPLRFDFALYQNGKIVCFIDTDGRQHFEWVKHFQKTIFDFRYAQECDRIKNAWCLRKGIPFIRIPYWDEEVLTLERILTYPNYRVHNKFHNQLIKR